MKPKLPQLNLRDLFWMVLVCALAVGWWVDARWMASDFKKAADSFILGQYNAEMREAALEAAIEREGFTIEREWNGGSDFTVKLVRDTAGETP